MLTSVSPPPAAAQELPSIAYSVESPTRHEVAVLSSGTARTLASSPSDTLTVDSYLTSDRLYYDVVKPLSQGSPRVDTLPTAGGAASTALPDARMLSSNGRTWVFERGYQLWKSAVGGGSAVRLTGATGTAPVLSPDGTRVLFSRLKPRGELTDFDVYVMRLDGTGLRQLTSASTMDIAAGWSPDSKRVLFSRQSFSGPPPLLQVLAADANGGHARVVADDASSPRWSRDGWIGFVRQAGGVQQVFVQPPGLTASPRQLTHSGANVSRFQFLGSTGGG